MVIELLSNIGCSFAGTLAYAIMFNVPRKYYLSCGLTGAAGWMIYKVIADYMMISAVTATFWGTLIIVLISRILTVRMKCPITVFLVPGIIPLVPGAGIYFTAYYLITDQLALALEQGMHSVKIAFAIVLGIVCVVSIPRQFFQPGYWRQRTLIIRRIRKG